MMEAEHDSVEILRELIGVGVLSEVAFDHSLEEGNGYETEPLSLQLDQPIPHRSRAIVHLAGRRGEDASTRQFGRPAPFQPALEERPESGLTAISLERWPDDVLDEHVRGMIEDLDLELFFGAEVGEQPTLGELEVVGQSTDGEAFEAGLTGQADGVVEDVFAGLSALGHGIE